MPKPNLTVRRALLALVVASVLPTFIAAVAALLYAYTKEQAGFRDGLRETTRALALVVDREIATREAVALTLSGSPTLTKGDLNAFREYALQIAPTRDKVVVLQDLAGHQLVNTRVPLGEPLPKSRNTQERIEAGPMPTVVSNLYFAPVGKQYSFSVQVPVVREGQVLYYLSVAGYASALQSVMTHQGLPEAWVFSILDRKGVVVARNKAPEQFVGKATSERLAAQMAKSAEGVFDSTAIDGTPILATFGKSPTYGWSVVVGVPLTAIPAPLESVALFGAFAAFLLGGALLLALAMGRRLLKPIERLKDASRALGSGHLLATEPTGLSETDHVLASLQEADRRITSANEALELRRQEAEASAVQVRESEARLLRLANTIPNLAWIADADGSITWYNDRWYAYTGTTLAEMEGWGWQAVHDPAVLPEVLQKWQESIRTGQEFEMTFPLRGADGIYRPFFTRVAPVSDSGGKLVQWFGTNTDVSPLKQAENELREADRRKDEFLAMLAHELRNPLAPIRTAAELLSRLQGTDSRVMKPSQVIARQVGHMSDLLDDLLDVSRITRGLILLDKEQVDVGVVIASAIEQVRPLIESRQHQIQVENKHPGACVLASRLRLTQVIANLLDNAAKYSAPGGTITVLIAPSGERVSIVVQDTGIGIAPGLLPLIFQPFTQAERAADRSQGGLGLGLAVVKGLVGLQDGSVTATSDGIGKGSRFEILLPLMPTSESTPGLPADPHPTESPAGTLDILVVDDNSDAADTLVVLLEAFGHRARSAYTATEGLEILRSDGFDAAILDIGLPDMSGYALATTIRESGLPAGMLIALSGYGQDHDKVASAAAGFSAHMVKPASPDVLLETLATVPARPRA